MEYKVSKYFFFKGALFTKQKNALCAMLLFWSTSSNHLALPVQDIGTSECLKNKLMLPENWNSSLIVGMGHGGEHGHGQTKLPDYRQWKIEGTPLEEVQRRLAKRGLRDPWAR